MPVPTLSSLGSNLPTLKLEGCLMYPQIYQLPFYYKPFLYLF